MKTHFLWPIIAGLIAANSLIAGCGGGGDRGQPAAPKVLILHTNDLHSYLMGHSPEADYTPLTVNDDATVGGMARLAVAIGKERGAAGSTPVLLLDAGDFMMGTPFEALGLSASAELAEMGGLGYDAITLAIMNSTGPRADLPALSAPPQRMVSACPFSRPICNTIWSTPATMTCNNSRAQASSSARRSEHCPTD
jgi:hypothetical protein